MCAHCEAHVTEALKKIGVDVTADHSKNRAVINSGEIDEAAIKQAVTDAGYKFVEIKNSMQKPHIVGLSICSLFNILNKQYSLLFVHCSF